MENNNTRRLGTLFDRSSFKRDVNTPTSTPEFTTYVHLVGYLLNRWPLDQIDSIEESDIEHVCQLAIFSAPIVMQTYTRFLQSSERQDVQRDRDRDRTRAVG